MLFSRCCDMVLWFIIRDAYLIFQPFLTHDCMCAKSLQSCSTLCNPMDHGLPGYPVHGIVQARILEWVAISSSRESSWSRDGTWVSCISCIGRQVLYHCATWEAPVYTQIYVRECLSPRCWYLGETRNILNIHQCRAGQMNNLWDPYPRE